MSRSKIFIIANIFLLLAGGAVFYFNTGQHRKGRLSKQVNTGKESKFRQDVVVLDSLYKQYVQSMNEGDAMQLASANAQFEKQILTMRKEYAGTAAPAVLSSKLIRNYQVRAILNEHLLKRKTILSGELRRLKATIAGLEEQNVELKTKNDMIRQVLLGLP